MGIEKVLWVVKIREKHVSSLLAHAPAEGIPGTGAFADGSTAADLEPLASSGYVMSMDVPGHLPAFRKGVYRSAEFVLLYAGLSVAQELSDSILVLILQLLVAAVFIASVISEAMKATGSRSLPVHFVVSVVAAVGAFLVLQAGEQASRAAIMQISSPKADVQTRRRAIRRRMMAQRYDCVDAEAYDLPSCQNFLRQEQAAENAVR